MLGIAIHCIQHSQAMLEHWVCELAHSFFHLFTMSFFNVKNEKYVLLERRSFKFKDGDCRWVYWCQCNENRARAISSLDHHLIRAYTGRL